MNRNKPPPDPNAPFLAEVPHAIQPAPTAGPPGPAPPWSAHARERWRLAIVADEKTYVETSLKFKKPDTMTQLDDNEQRIIVIIISPKEILGEHGSDL